MAVVIASNLKKELAGDQLFDGVSFKVERRERLALSGPNGAGKTTLLRILAGETELHGGELAFQKGTRIALHDQRPPIDHATRPGIVGVPDRREHEPGVLTLREYVLSGAHDLVATERELRELEEGMSAGDHDARTLRRYSDAQARLEHAGGYAWREHVGSVVRGLGFADAQLDRPLATFSGGELTRASLARALAGGPDLLLLDEPTNHLDVESLEWLEKELTEIDAAVIIVAHDRWFLEAVTTATLELEAGRSTYFPGSWHQWRQERAMRLAAASKAADRYEADIERLQRFVDRFRYKKSLAKRAQAKLSQIGRLEEERKETSAEIALLTRRSRKLGFDFLKPPRSGRVVVEVDGLDLAIGERRLVTGASFALDRGEHVVLLGPNGTGKTTLLEAILGRSPFAQGKVRLGHGVVPAYFSQHEVELDGTLSLLETAQKATGLQRPQAQNLLGRFLFSGWSVHEQKVGSLSGGERRRLALALVVASGANFLVLDEPTNHLDLESREALEAALEAFPGTVLLVSHDRALVDAVAERTLAIEDGRIVSHEGGFAEYARRRQELARPEPKPRKEPKPKAKPARPQPKRRTELELIEAEIASREEAVAELERKLAADWGDVEVLAAHRRARDELQALLSRWELLFEAQT